MQALREQMARIQGTEDPDERQRLMREHMQSMQQHMQMMGSMRAEQHAEQGPSRCAEADTRCRIDEMRAENGMAGQRMRALEDRLDSMQQLLQQLVDHQRATETQDADRRRRRD